MSRPVVVAANWKMNKTAAEAAAFLDALSPVPGGEGLEVVLAPVALHLAAVAARLAGTGVVVAAQNCHGTAGGAFTGEISATQVRDAGGRGVILGHSERRTLFGETDSGVAARLSGAVEAGLSAIVCVGEPLGVRDGGDAIPHVRRQLDGSLSAFPADEIPRLRIAYEPVWAIGTGRRAEVPLIDEMHGEIRAWLGETFGYTPASSVPILYGGSVTPESAPGLLSRPEVDGLLVGGASLDPRNFAALCAAGREAAGRRPA